MRPARPGVRGMASGVGRALEEGARPVRSAGEGRAPGRSAGRPRPAAGGGWRRRFARTTAATTVARTTSAMTANAIWMFSLLPSCGCVFSAGVALPALLSASGDFRQPLRDYRRGAVLTHGDPIEHVRHLHGPLLVSDDQDLGC